MSFHINSDKEKIRGVNPKLIGDNEATIRVGTGANEQEIMRLQKDPVSGLPRVGINRTGQRVNNIDIDQGGTGYNQVPIIEIDPPPTGGVQARASASIFNGRVTSVSVNEPGSGYTSVPGVAFIGGNGQGASATAFLDTVEFELDINGAIRTSTSIISDTARILNLDIENFITPDLNLRAPNLKTYMNGTGTPWASNVIVQKGQYRYAVSNVYQALNTGTTGILTPEHKDGVVTNGTVDFKHIGFRVSNPTDFDYLETGEAGAFPRSITPLLGDRSDKIATTEYVLNLATNDVGGRIYVSQQIGSDLNDGRSAVNPVRTIKKAAQEAWKTPGVKETLIVSGGNYVEDNPISLPPDCSVVGDNLRLVIIRPGNVGKHIFKFGDKNYVTGVTYRDKVDSNGDATGTWDFAMVFDDKQRIIIDNEVNGDFGVEFPVGHQVFGPDRFRISFQNNTGLALLQSGVQLLGLNTGARADSSGVSFNSTTGSNAFVAGTIDVTLTSGSFIEGDQYSYITSAAVGGALSQTISGTSGENTLRFTTDPSTDLPVSDVVFLDDTDNSSFTSGFYQVSVVNNGNAPTYWDVTFVPILGAIGWDSTLSDSTITVSSATPTTNTIDSTNLKSIRAEGEVVSYDEDIISTLPITRLDFSLQGDPSIATGGFQSDIYGDAEDIGGVVVYTSALVGRTNFHEFKEGQEIVLENLPTSGPDLSFLNGKQRIYKVLEDADGRCRRFVIPKKIPSLTTANFSPSEFAVVKSYSKSVTLSLLNSPNKFALATPTERRYQDACQLIRNNRDYIAEEVVGIINDQFKSDYYSVYNLDAVNNTFDIYLGPLDHANTYVSGGTVAFGGNSYAISDFVYDTLVTGVATITTTAAGISALSEDDTVQLADILISCTAGQKIYPSYSSPTNVNNGSNGDEQCKQDVIHFLNALVRDLEFGSNHNIIEAASKYIVNGKITYIEDEIIQNVRAIEYARELAIYAMCNWRIKNRTVSDPLYTTKYATSVRYTDPTIVNTTAGTPACDDVRSAIDTLAYLWADVITNDASGTYLDAAYLIAKNADLIADQALIDTEVAYPTLGLSNIRQRKCLRDIRLVIEGLVRDLVLGGNHGIVSAAESYFSGTVLSGIPEAQLDETRYAFQQVKDLAIAAMRNWSDGDVVPTTPTGSTYAPTTGILTVTFPNLAIIPSLQDRVAFAEGAITYSCAANGGGNDASPYRTDLNFGQSFALTNVSSSGGNTTITANVGVAGSNADVHTFVSALTGGTKIIYAPFATTSLIPKFEDWSILEDSANPSCAAIASAITTALTTFDSILEYASDPVNGAAPGSITQTFGTLYETNSLLTYPTSFINDFSNKRMAVRGVYDDYPIIEASPYTQNASVISFRGGGGAEIDGDKVKQPNCPFPGLEPDGTASFPNQGKSMVAAAFTIVSFGGTGYKVINDGYTQLVSVFVIFCQDGVLCETGGYASITNSATNFGTFALRGTGFRKDAYEFDAGVVNVVSQTPTGRTILTVGNIGREPLEHYIVKIDGYRNADPDKEFFIESVSGVTVGPPFTAILTIDDGIGNGLTLIRESDGATVSGLTALQQALTPSNAANAAIKLHRPSIVNSSSHTWEFAGSGTNYLALPENGGTKVEANEQVSENYGRVYVSGTDELGDFKVGTFARIENRTGNITFTGTVTISEVEFLKLKGGDVVVTGFDNSNTLGGANATDSKLPTQKAVKDYITNSLGPYINKPYSTNAVPRALVELTDSGKISLDQIPALRPFSIFTVVNEAERLSIEGALAGDIAIQDNSDVVDGSPQSFILNNDLSSLFLGFAVDPSLVFNIGEVFVGTPSTGRIQSTEYREGVLHKINITNGGSGYTVPPTVSITGGNPSAGAVPATATCTIANGEVVTVTITENAGFVGGFGYTTQPSIDIPAPPGAGTQATADGFIESRLYGNIVNAIKILDTDTFTDNDSPTNTINILRVVNTSSNIVSNWVSLSSEAVGVGSLTGPGVISTTLLGSEAANSFTFLRGDQRYAKTVQSLKGAETRYFARLFAQASLGSNSFIFQGLSGVLKGNTISDNVAGVVADTTVNGVTVVAGLTTVSFNNPIDANIPAGTVIEFGRGASPLVFDSTNTGGEFIDSVVIANPGTGFTDGQYFDVALDAPAGINGNDLRVNIIVGEDGRSGEVTTVTVTNAGNGFTQDFQITPNPSVIGSGSNLVLLAKVATTQKQFANISLDIQRVSDLTISQDLFGTIGVSRYKKSQFNIGTEGNGSVSIKMGPDSGLDADLLDGQQGSYYLNGAFFVDSSINPDKLASGTYGIDISGRSTNTLRVDTGISNPNANPSPSESIQGLTLQTLFNSSNGLLSAYPSVDTGNQNSAKHLVMTLRNGETGGDATYGGVRQLAFANDDRIYFRGSGDGVSNYNSWFEVWTSGNQGVSSGMDSDKLDNKEGVWYQDGWNIKENTIFETRLPTWRSSTKFRDKIEVASYGGTDTFYRIFVRQNLDTSAGGDFETTKTIDLYNVNKLSVGDFTITATDRNIDLNDSSNTYTMLTGRLSSGGNIEAAIYLGYAGDEREFEQYEIFDDNTVQYAELGNNSGTGYLRLGRYDGISATDPYVYFNSSQAQAVDNNGDPTYNSAIIATGGTATEGSGSIEIKVLNENELTVNSNIIWNAGNVAFNSSNVVSTASLKSAVMRDTSGNFTAGTITAGIIGAASLNVLKTGDTMTGGLTITGNNNLAIQGTGALNVGGNATLGADLTVDSGTLYVNSTNNRVLIGQTTESNPVKFNVYTASGDTEFATGSALSSQTTLYQSSVFNQVDTGESGIVLQHGASAAAQWGITTHRTGANVGELIIRTRTATATSATRLTISNGGSILPGADSDQDLGSDTVRWQNIYSDITHALNSVRIAKGVSNQEADIQFLGGGTGNGGGRGFRIGNNIGGGADVFEIYSSETNGADDWKSLATPDPLPPALAIQGTNNRVGINTNSFSGTDTTVTPNENRDYILNINGNMNIDGQLFQDNAEFVTSRWTKSTNDSGANIYRNSKVGIGDVASPAYQLHVKGGLNIEGSTYSSGQNQDVLWANGQAQWVDSYGIIKIQRTNINEDVTIPANVVSSSIGDIEIASGKTVTIASGGEWYIMD
ncbi:tail fiber protein [Synechococcus phage ACG-2014e]|uniref:Tail fiber-like protein n=1 Tax=Synechococcus phage ACG-2014e TaxID=1493510 RepID=A0A0E3HAV7_9CAUD|nr:tail fiber protein [Synechococcus phage ACG-2014e]YP_010355702.1 tail fiber protein [Synechococcus phage ACG-2014e]AIX20553.1 tail fiber-like protein [Synechococcus phage ACG-2014e]AIX45007.1 tail fiber-like protein [Synechococcus phage ACG-2014e]